MGDRRALIPSEEHRCFKLRWKHEDFWTLGECLKPFRRTAGGEVPINSVYSCRCYRDWALERQLAGTVVMESSYLEAVFGVAYLGHFSDFAQQTCQTPQVC